MLVLNLQISFWDLESLENWGKDTKNGKEEVFIFVFNHRISSFGNLLYQHCPWSVVTVWWFVLHRGKAGFFIFRGHFKAVTVLEKVLNFEKLFTNPLKLLVLTVEDIMAWVNVKTSNPSLPVLLRFMFGGEE